MERAQEITVQAVPWSDDAEAALSLACGTVWHISVDTLGRRVAEGAALFQVIAEGAVVGYYVLAVDGDEGVLLAAAGRVNGVDLTDCLMPIIEAQFVGCASLRVHTSRPGLVKKLVKNHGYNGVEIVVRKALK